MRRINVDMSVPNQVFENVSHYFSTMNEMNKMQPKLYSEFLYCNNALDTASVSKLPLGPVYYLIIRLAVRSPASALPFDFG